MILRSFPWVIWIQFTLLFATAVSRSDEPRKRGEARKRSRRVKTKSLLRMEESTAMDVEGIGQGAPAWQDIGNESLVESANKAQSDPTPPPTAPIFRRRRNFHVANDLIDPTTAVVPYQTGLFTHNAMNAMCDNCQEVYYEVDNLLSGDHNVWALVMKVGKNDLCFNSSKWTSDSAFATTQMRDRSLPVKNSEYDAKSRAFYRLQSVSKIKLESHRGVTVTVEFAGTGTPAELMTSDNVKLQYYPNFEDWKNVFADQGTFGYNQAPVFMRNGQSVLDPTPPCRSGNYDIQGDSATACTFCFYASQGDGTTCPTAGGPTDMTIGLGQSSDFDAAGCSTDMTRDTNSTWGDRTRLLVWAMVSAAELKAFETAGSR